MAETADVVWLVGSAEELSLLQSRLEPIDATVQETWPHGINAAVVALVRAAPADVDAAAAALEDCRQFDDEHTAISEAAKLSSSG